MAYHAGPMGALDFGIVGLFIARILVLAAGVSRRIGGFGDYFVVGGSMGAPILRRRRSEPAVWLRAGQF